MMKRIAEASPRFKARMAGVFYLLSVLQIRDVEKPVPNDKEVLIKVRAAFREQSLPG